MDRAKRWLKANTKRYAFKKLQREIIDPGICVECGACVSSCPVSVLEGDTSSGKYIPTLVGKCVSCGICYEMCPRTFTRWQEIAGEFRSIWKVKSLQDHYRQDGGAVTAILSYLLDANLVDGAVVACQDKKTTWLPKAQLVREKSQLKECAGTIYGHAPVVGAMMDAFKAGLHTLAVVGTSCDIDAINKMQTHPAGFFNVDTKSSVIKIGLFCMESFDYGKLKDWLKANDVEMEDIKRFAIAGGQFTVLTSDGERNWPVAELDPAVASSCPYCHDLTSVNADLSCGNIGSDEGHTTVIVRSIRGEQILQELIANELVEAELLETKELGRILNIARSKRHGFYKLESKK
jgi:coenzyme F420 hydrogenase subunit beta